MRDLPEHEFLGEEVRSKLIYYPTVTREPFRHTGRVTELLERPEFVEEIGLKPIDPAVDRMMLCGSPAMIADTKALLESKGFDEGSGTKPGHFVIEKAFVER